MGNNMNSFIKLKYSELETIQHLIKIYERGNDRAIESTLREANMPFTVFHNKIVNLSNKVFHEISKKDWEE